MIKPITTWIACCSVHIVLHSTSNVLRNVALNKRSYQVSTYTDEFGIAHSSSLANDGSRQTNSKRCVISQRETNPWWAVDLGVETLVAQVKLTNTGEADGMMI